LEHNAGAYGTALKVPIGSALAPVCPRLATTIWQIGLARIRSGHSRKSMSTGQPIPRIADFFAVEDPEDPWLRGYFHMLVSE
jgi:hypothetical protein